MAGPGPYDDRAAAGRALAVELTRFADAPQPLVLAIPRGGVAVARVVADELEVPMDVILVRKLPIPFAPETAFGVVADDGMHILDERLVAELNLDARTIEEVRDRVLQVLRRYADQFADLRPPVTVRGATAILIDDGLATGYTMLGAVRVCRKREAEQVVVAAPVSSDTAAELLEGEADDFVCPVIDPGFTGVSAYYREFDQLDDADVRRMLEQPQP